MSQKIASYAVYGGSGIVNSALSTQAPKSLEELSTAGGNIAVKTQDATWLTEKFPDAAAEGTLQLVNGSIYVHGIALTEIVTLTVAAISFLIVVVKGVNEIKNTLNKARLQAKEEELLDLKKKKLEDEAASKVNLPD